MRPKLILSALWTLLAAGAATAARPVTHAPAQPGSGQSVLITAQLQAWPGLSNASVHVQVVEPGRYVRRTDSAYSNSWERFSLRDDGQNGDTRAGDGSFAVQLPGSLHQHRRLIRYFISFTSGGVEHRLPAATNDCPNFAYFVYDGLPAWTGASVPGKTPELTFPAEFMATLPAYHLLARKDEVEQSQWDGNANKKRFWGTMVYDGRVYDHIQFHNRGKASTHVSGKNKWGFKFNESEPFQALDLWGRPYQSPWKSVSLTACASPWAPVNRGLAGMDEAVSFRAYHLGGVPAANTHWIQLRVITRTNEASARSQYSGDLWGLYQVVQEPNGDWLRERGLPDGDIYSPETGVKHRAKSSPTNDLAFQKFMAGAPPRETEAWWRTNLDLPKYYTFHALNRVLSNVDVRPGANHYLYRQPDGRWCVVPWDLDMMFIAKTHQPGFVDQARCLDVPALKKEYRTRAREILDLFCSDPAPNGGQFGQLVDELRGFLTPAGQARTWPELDMCVWNQHPRSNARGQFYVTPYRDGRFGGEWTRTLSSPDFNGFCRYLIEFCTDSRPVKNYAINDGDQHGYGFGYLSIEARDVRIPERPTLRLLSSPQAGAARLTVAVSAFQAAERATNSHFAAIQWRIGEISAPGLAGYQPGQPRKYELEEFWRSPEMTRFQDTAIIPTDLCQPRHTYRVRARVKDNTGRWSHWSGPVSFVQP